MERRRLFYIIAAPLVDWLRKQDFPMPQPPIRFYPDGSLWTDDYNVLRWTRESVICGRKHRQLLGVEMLVYDKLPGGCGSSRFRPLAAFGGDRGDAPQYTVLYPGSCEWMGEHELGPLMYPGILKDATKGEYDLAHVRVLVRLRRKFTQAVAEELAGAVRQWFTDIGSEGVFGEAGVKSISPAMRSLETEKGTLTIDGDRKGDTHH